MKTTLETSEDDHFRPESDLVVNGFSRLLQTIYIPKGIMGRVPSPVSGKLHSKRVKMKTTLETSEDENYTRNE